jgi:hypothetical protein
MPQWVSETKDIAIIIAGVIALTTFLNGVMEYARQGAQHRAQQFVQMRRRFMENDTFRELCTMLMTNDPRLRDIPIQDKRNFGGFLEELALMVNSRLIRKEVAHYMFGYYAILCWESENFWHGIDRESIYWSLFRDFVGEMKRLDGSFVYDRGTLRF